MLPAELDRAPAERNLILVHRKGFWDIADFFAIRDVIAARAPDIEVFIVDNHAPHSVTRRQAARRPTLVFSPTPLLEFKPARGRIYCGLHMPKIEEIRRLKAAGLPVPDTVMLEPDTSLDPATWGPLTVVEPNLGTMSAGVTVRRTHQVRWMDPFAWPEGDPRHGIDLLAQKFVDTGPYPSKYRVMAVFGRAVYCERQSTKVAAYQIDPGGSGPIEGLIAHGGVGRTNMPNYDADALAFASLTAMVFPEIPVHCIDLVREEKSGKLFLLEINPIGNWHLSSPLGKRAQRRDEINRYEQFDALSVIADALIEKTRTEAE